MKYVNMVGGILFALMIWIGSQQPGPGPGPTPDPKPVVIDEKPLIDADGLHVLIVEEKDDRRNLPIKQASVLIPSSQISGWFSDHQAQWRILDINTEDLSQEDAKWQQAMKDVKPESLPWIHFQNGRKTLFKGPLPGSVDDTVALLNKYAPAGKAE